MAFRGDSTATYTYATNSTGGTVDMGARNNYRYVNATNVYNKGKSDGVTTHTGTYTLTTSDFGLTKDLGVNHTYRYIGVPSKPTGEIIGGYGISQNSSYTFSNVIKGDLFFGSGTPFYPAQNISDTLIGLERKSTTAGTSTVNYLEATQNSPSVTIANAGGHGMVAIIVRL